MGLPLMIAIIGGETHRFRPLVDLYKNAGRAAGHPEERLKVGLHSLGYVAKTKEEAEKVIRETEKKRKKISFNYILLALAASFYTLSLQLY